MSIVGSIAREWAERSSGVAGVQEFRSSGVQEFRSSGVQEFRSSGVQEFRSSGVQELQYGKDRILSSTLYNVVLTCYDNSSIFTAWDTPPQQIWRPFWKRSPSCLLPTRAQSSPTGEPLQLLDSFFCIRRVGFAG